MFRSSALKIILGAVVVVAALALLRYRPWQRPAAAGGGGPATGSVSTVSDDGREKLTVGFLPVT